jgi:hypothetical protein
VHSMLSARLMHRSSSKVFGTYSHVVVVVVGECMRLSKGRVVSDEGGECIA